MNSADYRYDDWTARIAAAHLGDHWAEGVVTGKPVGALDLRITPKTTVRHPLAHFDGEMVTEPADVIGLTYTDTGLVFRIFCWSPLGWMITRSSSMPSQITVVSAAAG